MTAKAQEQFDRLKALIDQLPPAQRVDLGLALRELRREVGKGKR